VKMKVKVKMSLMVMVTGMIMIMIMMMAFFSDADNCNIDGDDLLEAPGARLGDTQCYSIAIGAPAKQNLY